MGKEIYCNCHYHYNGRLCEVTGIENDGTLNEDKVRIRFSDNKEILCNPAELDTIPLTEAILQSCFKYKTILHNDEWDTIWYLGGKNNVSIGEKNKKLYLLPSEETEPIVDILIGGFFQTKESKEQEEPIPIHCTHQLEKVHPELMHIIRQGKKIKL